MQSSSCRVRPAAVGRTCLNLRVPVHLPPAQATSAQPESRVHFLHQHPLSTVLSPWPGMDEFSHLNDRHKAAPLPLPPVQGQQLVTIVRHGQSTWNAESMVQGSSDLSVLTEKGLKQAQATRDMLAEETFDQLWYSPLARAAKTAEIVWGRRVAPQHCDPVLREIDLYSFQGLSKVDVKQRYAAQYQLWQAAPEEFELDGHFPVFESWYRASLAWHKILRLCDPKGSHSLVVAHNNTNQALIATALQLPVTFFRRLTQCNAAISQLQFTPAEHPGSPPEAVLLCLNKGSSTHPLKPDAKVKSRVMLLRYHPDAIQQAACVETISHAAVRHVAVLPSNDSAITAGQQALAARLAERCRTPAGEEPDIITLFEEAGNESWQSILRAASDEGGSDVVVVLDSQAAAGLTCSAFGLGQVARHKFSFCPGGLTVFEFAGLAATTQAVARCINSTSHLVEVDPLSDSDAALEPTAQQTQTQEGLATNGSPAA